LSLVWFYLRIQAGKSAEFREFDIATLAGRAASAISFALGWQAMIKKINTQDMDTVFIDLAILSIQ